MKRNFVEPAKINQEEKERFELLEFMLDLQLKRERLINRMAIWIFFLAIAGGYGTVKAIEFLIKSIAS